MSFLVIISIAFQAADMMADAQTLEEVCMAQSSRVTAALSGLGRGIQKSRRSAAMRLPPSMRQNAPSPLEAPPVGAGAAGASPGDVEVKHATSSGHGHAGPGRTGVWQLLTCGGEFSSKCAHDVRRNSGLYCRHICLLFDVKLNFKSRNGLHPSGR